MADSSGVPVVKAEAIKKSFGQHVVLDGIDLDVGHGEALVVIGASGSGKSTLRCINLLEPIDSGRVFLEGEEITRKGAKVAAIRQRIDRLPAVQPVPAPEGDRQRDTPRRAAGAQDA